MDFHPLDSSLEYQFGTFDLLHRALTHRSRSAEHNERLEFLGDGVLNCVIALELYCKFPALPEGELSRLRASLVSQPTLFALAEQLDLGSHLLLGEGELKSGGDHRPSILSDTLEAVFGAVFLDGGFDAARNVICNVFKASLDKIDPSNTGKDSKTLLQELLQDRRLPLPRYTVTAIHGEAHQQNFEVECVIEPLNIRCTGTGTSRRRAEQDAARQAYVQAIAV